MPMAVFQQKGTPNMELLTTIINDMGKLNTPDKRLYWGGKSRRTYQPVRRYSYLAGREGGFWRSTKRQNVRQIVLAAKKYELHTKVFNKRTGALGGVAIEILDYLANLVDYRTGRLDPSIKTMMEKLRRSRDAIVRGLKALRAHGFIDWLRRYVPTGNEGAGVQVQQTSNAYRLSMPQRALKLLGRYGQKAPLPDDYTHAQEQQAAMIEEHRASLSLLERTMFDCSDDRLGQSLVRFAKAMQECESAKQTESLSQFYSIDKKDRLPPDIK